MLTNQQLVSAMRHPTRAHAVTVLNERVANAAEIGRELGRPARHVDYHLKQLAKYGVIEVVRENSREGIFYRALVRSWYDPESWSQIDSQHQPGITASILASCNADMAAAVQSGTIHHVNNHISRTPLLLDPAGYRELVDRLDALLPEVIEVQQRSAAQMARSDETVLAKVHIIQFVSPDIGVRANPIVSLPSRSDTEPPNLGEDALLYALEHPTRVHALMVLNEYAACAADIGRELGRPAYHVSYHLKKLANLGLIETVATPQIPGGRSNATFYRALIRPWFDLENWERVDPKRQAVITATMLGLCNGDIADAVRSGTMNEPDTHISRTPIIVDRRSYSQLVGLLDRVISDVLSIQERSKERLNRGAKRIATKLQLFLFESPDPSQNEHTDRTRP